MQQILEATILKEGIAKLRYKVLFTSTRQQEWLSLRRISTLAHTQGRKSKGVADHRLSSSNGAVKQLRDTPKLY